MFAIAGENLTERLRNITFRVSVTASSFEFSQAILRQNIRWFDEEENASGILTARLSREAALVEGLVGSRIALSGLST